MFLIEFRLISQCSHITSCWTNFPVWIFPFHPYHIEIWLHVNMQISSLHLASSLIFSFFFFFKAKYFWWIKKTFQMWQSLTMCGLTAFWREDCFPVFVAKILFSVTHNWKLYHLRVCPFIPITNGHWRDVWDTTVNIAVHLWSYHQRQS